MHQCITELMDPWIHESMPPMHHHWINGSIHQCINKTMTQRSTASMKQWTKEARDHWTMHLWNNESMHQWITASIDQWIHAAMHQDIKFSPRARHPTKNPSVFPFACGHSNLNFWTSRASPFSCFLLLRFALKWHSSGRKNSKTSFQGTLK